MKISSIKSKIMISMILMVSLVVVLSSSATFLVTSVQIENRYLSEIDSMIYATEYLLEDVLSDADFSIKSVVTQLKALNNLDLSMDVINESLEPILSGVKSNIANATTLYFGNERGAFYMSPKRFIEPSYDPRVRSWYILAKGSPDKTQWSEPYIDVGTGELVITGAQFITFKNGESGAVGVDLLLSDIRSIMQKTGFGSVGDLLLVNQDHQILVSRTSQLENQHLDMINKALTDLEDGQRFSDGETTYFKRTLETQSYYFIGCVPNKAISEISRLALTSIGIVGFLTIVLVFFVASRVARYLSKPIIALTKTMRIARSGDYQILCDVKSQDEVGELIIGFNDMIQSFNDHHNEMTTLYEALYASEETLKNQYDALYLNRENIRESEERYRAIFEASKEGLWVMESDGSFKLLSKDWYSRFDLDVESSTLQEWQALIHPDDRELVQGAISESVAKRIAIYESEFRVMDLHGSYRWIQSVGKVFYNEEGSWTRIIGSHIDVTVRKENEARIHALAYKDALTNLGNRFTIQEFIEKEIADQKEGAILFIDIDNFKYINDTFGHPLGDLVLKETANRLKKIAPSEAQVARFSGDEYVVVLCGLSEREQIVLFIEQLLAELNQEILVDDRTVKINVSIGVTVYPKDASNLTELLRHADLATYAAKERSGIEYVFYDDAFKAEVLGRIQMENYLKNALSFNEIYVMYQPIVGLPSQQVIGFEALVRWQHPQWGLVSPDVFIPIAEKTGMIVSLGAFVLESAIIFIKQINRNRTQKLSISVNISVLQLMHAHFEADLMRVVKKYALDLNVLKLEVTESIALERDSFVISKLQKLQELGIGLSLDDFGSGYSSINNLLNLPLTQLKIDKQLVHKMVVDRHVSAMVQAVLSYCQSTNIKTVAEGVETRGQLKSLLNMGFDSIQGYYYSKPLLEEDVLKCLDEWVHEPFPGSDY